MTHCWKDLTEWSAETFGEDSPEHIDSYERCGTCLLPAGHSGPHEFTPDDEIVVSFKKEPA